MRTGIYLVDIATGDRIYDAISISVEIDGRWIQKSTSGGIAIFDIPELGRYSVIVTGNTNWKYSQTFITWTFEGQGLPIQLRSYEATEPHDVVVYARDNDTDAAISGVSVTLQAKTKQTDTARGAAYFTGIWGPNRLILKKNGYTIYNEVVYCDVSAFIVSLISLSENFQACLHVTDSVTGLSVPAARVRICLWPMGYTNTDGDACKDIKHGLHGVYGNKDGYENFYTTHRFEPEDPDFAFSMIPLEEPEPEPEPETYSAYIVVSPRGHPETIIPSAIMYLMHGIHGEFWKYADHNGIISLENMPAAGPYDGWVEAPGYEVKYLSGIFLPLGSTYGSPYLIYLDGAPEPDVPEGGLHISSISPETIPNGIYHAENPIEIFTTILNDTDVTKEVRVKMRSTGGKVLDTEPDLHWKNIPAGGIDMISVAYAWVIPASFKNEYITIELWEQHTGKVDTKHVTVGDPDHEPEKPPDTGYGSLIIPIVLIGAGAYVLGEMLRK